MSPEVAIATARRVARRTVFPGVDERRRRRTDHTVSFVSTSVPTARLEAMREVSAAALGASGNVVACGSDRATEIFETVRHSDRVVVVVADATNAVHVGAVVDMVLRGIDRLAAPALELVVIDEPGGRPARWRLPRASAID